MENKNGQGLFLGVVGVATLVVAIIGATFAFFSASVTGSAPVNAESYKFAMTLTVTKVDPSTAPAKGEKLIPLNDTDHTTAITNGCTDTNGYMACVIYSLTFNNTGAATTLNGTLTPTANGYTNLYYKVTGISGTKASLATATGHQFAANANTAQTADLQGISVPAGTSTMYLMLYIKNLTSNQTADQGKTFSGTLTFVDATGGNELKATFN